jgi:phage terminase large subunit-like protein
MPTEAQREAARQRKANQRAREKGLPEPYSKATLEEVANRVSQHELDFVWAKELDESGKYYKSECRSCVDLLAIYEGADILDKDSEEDDTSRVKKKSKGPKRPNPSQQKITIRAVETEVAGVIIKLEPNCAAEFKILKEVDEVVSFRRWLDLRDKGRKDLFWLCRLLGKGLFHSTHQYICDQFLQKQFDGAYFPGYTLDDFHEAIANQKRFANDGITLCSLLLLLEQRGGYKSTINGVDAAQILINCPDARIMFITAFRHLAKKLAKEIKGYFYLSQKGEPSAFHLLFPEFILTGVAGRSKEPLECPARNLNQKEPSLWVTSMESSATGDHCDFLKADDIVDPKNSADSEMREELKYEFDSICLDIRDPWGKIDVTGTRYFTDDWYGTRTRTNDKSGRVAPLRYSCRGSWILNAETHLAYTSGEITLYDIIDKKLGTLVFPYRLGWGKLRDILDEKGERGFKNQQLNEATDADADDSFVTHFQETVLRAHCYPKESAPKVGEIFQAWDWAYSDHKTSDFSVGVTAILYQNQRNEYALAILDVVYDKWKSSELVFQMISFHKKWNPKKVLIEKANGSELLEPLLKIHAQRLGSSISNDIWWKEVDNHSNAKSNRVKSLELLINDDRLHFVNGAWLDEAFKQLKAYNGQKSTGSRKDDIPDAMSFLVKFFPPGALYGNSTVDAVQAQREMDEQQRKAMLKAMHDAMFGNKGGGYTPPSAAPASAPEPQPDPRRAAMSKIFGGNGMRA